MLQIDLQISFINNNNRQAIIMPNYSYDNHLNKKKINSSFIKKNKQLKQRFQTLPVSSQHQKHHLNDYYHHQNSQSKLKIITHSRVNQSGQLVNINPKNRFNTLNDLNHFSREKKFNPRIMKNRRYSQANSPNSFSSQKYKYLQHRRSLKHSSNINSQNKQFQKKSLNVKNIAKKLADTSNADRHYNNNSKSRHNYQFDDFTDQTNRESVPYIERMQKVQAQKNKRIKQIYNPTPKTKSIGLLRSKMPINSTLNTINKKYDQELKCDTPIYRKNNVAIFNTTPLQFSQKIPKQQQSKISKVTKQKVPQVQIGPQQNKSIAENKMPLPKFSKFYDSYQMKTKTGSFSFLHNNQAHLSNNQTFQNQSYSINEPAVNFTPNNNNNNNNNHHHQVLAPNKNHIPMLQFLSDLKEITDIKIVKQEQGVYYGQTNQNGIKSGRGVYFHISGTIYQGQFLNGFKQGNGKQSFPDGSSYLGAYKQSLRHGKGRFQWPNGQVYDGQWEDNKKHGSGLWQDPKGSSYLGQWKEDMISGFGVLTSISKIEGQDGYQRYEGQFVNFSKEGQGTYRFPNGQKIIGIFHKNQPNGQCEYYWPNGDHFKGQFRNGLRHGKGQMMYHNGAEFEGQFRNDKKCGFGRQTYYDGIKYIGNFQNDLRHGYGKLQYNETIYYQGYWLNNRAVIFQNEQQQKTQQKNNKNNEQGGEMQPIEEDVINQRLVSRFSKNLSHQKISKLNKDQKNRLIRAMKSKQKNVKLHTQKFSNKDLLQRLYNPKKRACRCAAKH